MKREYFTRQEAFDKIGVDVEYLVEFADVPKGTKGKVTRAFQRDWDSWAIAVEWELSEAKPRWFTKDEFRKFLREIV